MVEMTRKNGIDHQLLSLSVVKSVALFFLCTVHMHWFVLPKNSTRRLPVIDIFVFPALRLVLDMMTKVVNCLRDELAINVSIYDDYVKDLLGAETSLLQIPI